MRCLLVAVVFLLIAVVHGTFHHKRHWLKGHGLKGHGLGGDWVRKEHDDDHVRKAAVFAAAEIGLRFGKQCYPSLITSAYLKFQAALGIKTFRIRLRVAEEDNEYGFRKDCDAVVTCRGDKYTLKSHDCYKIKESDGGSSGGDWQKKGSNDGGVRKVADFAALQIGLRFGIGRRCYPSLISSAFFRVSAGIKFYKLRFRVAAEVDEESEVRFRRECDAIVRYEGDKMILDSSKCNEIEDSDSESEEDVWKVRKSDDEGVRKVAVFAAAEIGLGFGYRGCYPSLITSAFLKIRAGIKLYKLKFRVAAEDEDWVRRECDAIVRYRGDKMILESSKCFEIKESDSGSEEGEWEKKNSDDEAIRKVAFFAAGEIGIRFNKRFYPSLISSAFLRISAGVKIYKLKVRFSAEVDDDSESRFWRECDVIVRHRGKKMTLENSQCTEIEVVDDDIEGGDWRKESSDDDNIRRVAGFVAGEIGLRYRKKFYPSLISSAFFKAATGYKAYKLKLILGIEGSESSESRQECDVIVRHRGDKMILERSKCYRWVEEYDDDDGGSCHRCS